MIKLVFLILGILAILYGGVIFLAGSGTMFFTVWVFIGGFFLAWSFFGYKEYTDNCKWLKKLGYSFIITCVILLTILCCFIGTEFHSKGAKDLDYIIVLGAQVYENGPSPILKFRLDAAIEYLNENPDTRCIVTGGKGYNEPRPEGQVMAEYLMENHIDQNRILIEDKATNTIENIQYSIELMKTDYKNVGIVTNDFHVFRAVKLAKAQGLKHVYGIAGDSHPIYLPNNILRECLAIVKECLKGNINLSF